MELFRRTLAGLLMLVVAVSVGIWVQGKFIDAVRLPVFSFGNGRRGAEPNF